MNSEEVEYRRPSADELIDAWEAAWNGRDGDAFLSICSARIHYEDPVVSQPLEGPRALAVHADRLWSAFPDARMQRLAPRLSNGRYIAAPVKLLATHREPLDSLPPTGRFVVVPGVFYCEVQGGKLLRVRAFFDLYDAATQLGILPARGTLSEKALLILRGFGLRTGR